jgi:hypothetical protein
LKEKESIILNKKIILDGQVFPAKQILLAYLEMSKKDQKSNWK